MPNFISNLELEFVWMFLFFIDGFCEEEWDEFGRGRGKYWGESLMKRDFEGK